MLVVRGEIAQQETVPTVLDGGILTSGLNIAIIDDGALETSVAFSTLS